MISQESRKHYLCEPIFSRNSLIYPIIAIILFSSFNIRCKNPGEYEPPQDSLVPPPAAPQLIVPVDSVLFSLTPGASIDIYFEWSSVENAEFYDIVFADDVSFSNIIQQNQISYNSTTITFDILGGFFWRVRAYGPKWIWYTNWSSIRYFLISSVQ